MRKFDVIVIGSGAAGQSAAFDLKKADLSVALIESYKFGGTCALRGCDPKKVLIGIAEVYDQVEALKGKGIAAKNSHINWQELMQFKDTFTENIPTKIEEELLQAGIEPINSEAKFIDSHTIEVDGEELQADNYVIAAGAKPRTLKFPGNELLTTSEDFLELSELPQDIVFAGGGYISFEFASLAIRAGSHCTIVHRSQQALKQFDPEQVEQVISQLKNMGVEFIFESEVESVDKEGKQLYLHTSSGETIVTDMVMHGMGRTADVKGLGLDAAGVEFSDSGIKVDNKLRTSQKHIYAVGDVAELGLPLTPVAGSQGRLAAYNIINKEDDSLDYFYIPSVMFNIPPLARAGMLESEARQAGINIEVKVNNMSDWYFSKRLNNELAYAKIIIDKDNDLIIGAHLLGPHMDEVINIFALAIREKLAPDRLEDFIYSYPTVASNIPYLLK